MSVWTIKSILSWTDAYFSQRSIDSPRLTAEILLAQTLGLRRLDLYLQHDRPLERQELAAFKIFIRRRVAREPVAYITGRKGFFKEQFKVAPGVLIPRPDTETLVETAIGLLSEMERCGRQARVMELGVGSGAVIISIANACKGHLYFGSELSLVALAMACANVKAFARTSVALFRGDWLAPVTPQPLFDLILSNPPYIPSADIESLAPEIRDHEPRQALDGGADGLDAVRVILAQAGERLLPYGRLILEIGYDQKPLVKSLAQGFNWVAELDFIKDLAGHYRLAVFKK
ncbi:peptide chain release factor N(5)-glutamine methyltransferase [Desulfobacter hydrogenophilus]|uniref:Release factor glutamine methyltransferase n=1 Tax=Desulfobacter hydrogenophilus TaxID=2291 RepID=A0A328FAW9_9BACT|nr:peptide chain release factor N(5)-glutamine methyltransferase [Desulfobacter hydrogenophilus]NDY73238.1 peptide chain release factor N(5)-glutamine methyltransferase [Desulfobacter hydrogenophilus]QBH13816.1 peptide chain release factor N(5)-glutamine methyltransferase [Desulfobacter hydrogenophilus]RAM00830.1 peptide chain release factor N(5)-glutamine methyltransferase [Desulfobacter hydrogenophilus]